MLSFVRHDLESNMFLPGASTQSVSTYTVLLQTWPYKVARAGPNGFFRADSRQPERFCSHTLRHYFLKNYVDEKQNQNFA